MKDLNTKNQGLKYIYVKTNVTIAIYYKWN